MQLAIQSKYFLSDNDIISGETSAEYVLRVKDLPSEERPREKMLLHGPKSMTVPELIAALMGTGTKKEDVLSMSKRVLKEYGEKAIINEANPKNLAETLDIPVVKACQILAGLELGRRFHAKSAGKFVFVRNAEQAFHYLKDMGSSRKEQLRGLYLNSRYTVVRDEIISVGSLTSNIIHPREVFQPAIEHGAVAVIIAHNHPSGVLRPTQEDLEVTEQLFTAGKILGIDLLDHLIIAKDRYMSIMDAIHKD